MSANNSPVKVDIEVKVETDSQINTAAPIVEQVADNV